MLKQSLFFRCGGTTQPSLTQRIEPLLIFRKRFTPILCLQLVRGVYQEWTFNRNKYFTGALILSLVSLLVPNKHPEAAIDLATEVLDRPSLLGIPHSIVPAVVSGRRE